MKCVACNRKASEDRYCTLHMQAYKSIVEGHKAWKKALKLSWKEYLREIIKNPLTGEWAKEVAEQIIKTGEK